MCAYSVFSLGLKQRFVTKIAFGSFHVISFTPKNLVKKEKRVTGSFWETSGNAI